ncbi:MAG: hypothetical protein HY055_13830 [Magnetospirillum sp.]|nr:hypothetical protein [Magnetospirillum sp.]
MTLRTKDCNFRLVSEAGQRLMEADNAQELVAFTRATLSCPRLRVCEFGDYCTIFSASLLSECGKHALDTPDE